MTRRPRTDGGGTTVARSLLVLVLVWIVAIAIRRPRGRSRVRVDTAWAALAGGMDVQLLTRTARCLAWLGGPGSVPLAIAIALPLWRRRDLRTALTFVAAALLSQRNVSAMKSLGVRRRPDGRIWDGVGSFPSGHTAYAAVIAVTAAVLLRRPAAVVGGAGGVAAMALSRTVLDAHWLSDTLGGAASGAAMAALVWTSHDPRA